MELHGGGRAAGQAILAGWVQVQGEVQREVLQVLAVGRRRVLCPGEEGRVEMRRFIFNAF